MRLLKTVLTIFTILTGVIGDHIVFRSKYSESQIFRAIADSAIHAFIGFLSAAIFFSHRLNVSFQSSIYYIILCTMVSSLIDIDHIFVARSVYLKDLTNLKQRGIFHCTTFWLLFTTILLIYSYVAKKINISILTYMLILAFTSHHLRDGNRRGLWMYPFGHTMAINKYVYVILTALLPHVFAYSFIVMKQQFNLKEALMETV